jgi:serine/threonine protein kinase
VQTYEVGTEGDRHVMVMEYLEGQSLSAIMKRAEHSGSPLPMKLHLRVLINALEGLHYAHELRAYDGAPLELVHRDISPQNIFVTYDGQVKVLDFGIAKAASSSTHTATGVVKGKVAYMAPEQTVADAIDRRADIYSLGSMLWAVAAGRKLWKDMPDVQIMRRVINGEVPSPQSMNPGCDGELNRIVMKALAPDPNDRYPTALDMQHDLERYAEGTGRVVKQKEMAQYVSTLFDDTRTSLKLLIERQLALVTAEESFSTPISSGNTSQVRSSPRHGPASSLRPSSVPTTLENPRKKGFGGLFAVGAIAGLLVGAAVYFPRQPTQPRRSPAVAVASRAAPAEAPSAAPAPTQATLRFSASPTDAELFLDDRKLPSNPTSEVLAIDGTVHRLRAEAKGYATEVVELSPTHDDSIALELTPAPGPSKRVSTRSYVGVGKRLPPSPTPASATPAPEVPKKPACDQPFFIGSDGIKKIRPECL